MAVRLVERSRRLFGGYSRPRYFSINRALGRSGKVNGGVYQVSVQPTGGGRAAINGGLRAALDKTNSAPASR
jgi:hypothetical protein